MKRKLIKGGIIKRFRNVPTFEKPIKDDDYFRPSLLKWKRFGSDNLFPQAVAIINRKSPVHRGILNSKARYIAGKGFAYEETQEELKDFVLAANAKGESLREVTKKLVFDELSFGNSWAELVTNKEKTFLNIFHKDSTKCRLSSDAKECLLHPNWTNVYNRFSEIKGIPIYPEFKEAENGLLRSIIHFKDYEPDFDFYGIPSYIAGMRVVGILYKTDKWNLSRLDNSFQTSGIVLVDGEFENDEEANDLKEEFKKEFTGEDSQGKILFIARSLGGGTTSYTPINTQNDADWIGLDQNSTEKLIVAHEWYRSLCSLGDNTGFDTKRILNEYQVALNTVIADVQEKYLDKYKEMLLRVLGLDATSLSFVNKPPISVKPKYMKVHEARKADGFEYDEEDPKQNQYLAELGTKRSNNNE